MTIYIYGLWDPRTYELRYIGRTSNPYYRFRSHISETVKNRGHNTHKENWIKELLREGLEPSFEILEECSKENYQEMEILWIKEAKEKGANLTNIAKGGDGWGYGVDNPNFGKYGEEHHSFGRKVSEETKVKMKLAQAQKKMPADAKEKIRKTVKNIWDTDDEFRIKRDKGLNKPSTKKRMSDSQTKRWTNQEIRDKQSEVSKRNWENPELAKQMKDKISERWKDESYKISQSLARQISWAKRKNDMPRVEELKQKYFEIFKREYKPQRKDVS